MRYRTKQPLSIWRNMAHMSQEDLAEALRARGLKTTQTTISFWETGRSYPNAKAIAELEKVLKIKWSDDIIMP